MEKLQQYQRHNIILDRLKNGETLSITILSREWGIPTKTIQRDFKKLQEGNYSVVRADDGKRFQLAKQKCTQNETSSTLKLLDSFSADIGGKFYTKAQNALKRTEPYVNTSFYTRIDVEDISEKASLVEQIEMAIAEKKTISFDYKRHYKPNEVKRYTHVKPYKIIVFDGFFYLYSQHHNYFPSFYLKEITNLQIEDKTFTYDENIVSALTKAQNIWFNPKKEPFEVILFVDSVVRIYFERKPLKDQFMKKYPDDTAEVSISITDKQEVFSLLQKWLPHIKVLEPEVLQYEFENMLDGYIKYCRRT
ncbi:transcriptional regulator, putative [hydrothermal vent metagenome]|uniref:Transcriptional regulator, putative n=1 Tax=hydrothermal vent metagenome TaxID=652676 RepID=A0A1W1BT95_9ZZZZ